LEDPSADVIVVFCEEKFGSTDPWGIMNLSTRSMGMDANWHVALEHAVRNSSIWKGRNPIGYEVP